jgi:hypothetical protein
MAVTFQGVQPEEDFSDVDPRIDKWYFRLRKYEFMVPLYPDDELHKGKWWYKLGYSACWFSSIWFYLLALYFLILAFIHGFDLFYPIFSLGWIVFGLTVPVGCYQSIIAYLIRKRKIY